MIRFLLESDIYCLLLYWFEEEELLLFGFFISFLYRIVINVIGEVNFSKMVLKVIIYLGILFIGFVLLRWIINK